MLDVPTIDQLSALRKGLQMRNSLYLFAHYR